MHRRRLLRIAQNLPKTWRPIPPGMPRRPHPLPIQLAHVTQWFHALSEDTRWAILELLSQRERSVSELTGILDAPQSTVSFHLKVLRESGLVRVHRDGRWRYYGLRADTLEHMASFTQIIGPGKHVGTCLLSCCQ